jgi:sucrose-6-phosphate hydrolase SacC (GH32 family)
VLILNLENSGFQRGGGSRYVVGQFDGSKFVAFGDEQTQVRYLDYGADFSSVSTFFDFGLNPSQRTGIAWMSSSRYFDKLPTTSFRG